MVPNPDCPKGEVLELFVSGLVTFPNGEGLVSVCVLLAAKDEPNPLAGLFSAAGVGDSFTFEEPKPEEPNPEEPKPEEPKPELPKPEVAGLLKPEESEVLVVVFPKPELPKPVLPKLEPPNPELPKPELFSPEELKALDPKPDELLELLFGADCPKAPELVEVFTLPKADPPTPELPKPEFPKPDPPKPDPPKPDLLLSPAGEESFV